MRRMRTPIFLVIAYLLATSLAYSQGTPALLRCAFNGGLDVYARPEPSSPIIARVKCGDQLVLVEPGSPPHVRTQDGKNGFILSHNLGQWSIVPEASPSSTAVNTARPTAGPTTSSTAATTPNQMSTPNVPTSRPNVSTSSASTPTEPRPTAIEPVSAPRRDMGRTKISDIKIHGYVTAINSPTSFDIEDYRITRDVAFKLEFENPSSDLSFRIEDVRVGTELENPGYLR